MRDIKRIWRIFRREGLAQRAAYYAGVDRNLDKDWNRPFSSLTPYEKRRIENLLLTHGVTLEDLR